MNDDLVLLRIALREVVRNLPVDARGSIHRATFGKGGLVDALLQQLAAMDPDARSRRGYAINQFCNELRPLFGPEADYSLPAEQG